MADQGAPVVFYPWELFGGRLSHALKTAQIRKPKRIKATMIKLIQIGLKTQSHDQCITPQSLRAMNTMVRRPVNPMPEDEDDC